MVRAPPFRSACYGKAQVGISDGTTNYSYGSQRVGSSAAGGDTWELHDALGSVRLTLDATGTVQAALTYAAWGVPQAGRPAPFGFTGELQLGGLVYLRARWYAAGAGVFTGRDPFAGWSERPYSLHPYQYAYSSPAVWTDPSGKTPPDRTPNPYPEPEPTPQPTPQPRPNPGPYVPEPCSPLPREVPEDIGYLEGASVTGYALGGVTGALEQVYNLYDMEYGLFTAFGGGLFALWGAEATGYAGTVTGWSNFSLDPGIHNYAGPAWAISASLQIPFIRLAAVGGAYFRNRDKSMEGRVMAFTLAAPSLNPSPVGASWTVADYTLRVKLSFRTGLGRLPSASDGARFAAFIWYNQD